LVSAGRQFDVDFLESRLLDRGGELGNARVPIRLRGERSWGTRR
jgi:hypothetical protein